MCASNKRVKKHTTFKTTFEFMKKNYIAPQTEAIEIFASQVLMASPTGAGNFDMMYGTGGDGGGMG